MFRYKSPEGVKEFEGTNRKYEDSVHDLLYQHHLELISKDSNKYEVIESIQRVKTDSPDANGNTEFITYSATSYGRDSVYQRKRSYYRSGLGSYIALQKEEIRTPSQTMLSNPDLQMQFDINDRPKSVNDASLFDKRIEILGENIAYSIPYTKETLNAMKDRTTNKTVLSVVKDGGTEVAVKCGWEEFVSTSFDTLYQFGKNPTKEEREVFLTVMANRYKQRIDTTTTAAITPMELMA
jgi:hypothetical protein